MRAVARTIPAEDQRDVVGRAETHNSPLNQIFTNKGLKLSRINPASTEVKPMRIPLITADEWRSIAPLLPPTDGPCKARHGDRLYVSAFYYAEATRSSLENLPAAYGNPRLLRTRRQRLERDGVLCKLMEAGAPVIARMKAGYLNLIRDASVHRQNSSEFFGRGVIPRLPHMEPRGRYAARRQVPAG